ncbi:MAG: hypothetical protein H0A75_05490 [Candidatus Methanofishera endochildressiae]|uniref:Uncharacterized protein n=1 Tax=Candidatus Methanofishera endochildressiae TaxID=2738884 RepID=A0A7Z0MNU7_9GAMM|nr:hypothetical protein [Candidatus Methanofishera endochildressiae]
MNSLRGLHSDEHFSPELNRIIRFDNIDQQLDNPPNAAVIYDQFPSKQGMAGNTYALARMINFIPRSAHPVISVSQKIYLVPWCA